MKFSSEQENSLRVTALIHPPELRLHWCRACGCILGMKNYDSRKGPSEPTWLCTISFWTSVRTGAQDIVDSVRRSCYTYLGNGDRLYTASTAKIRARISTTEESAKLYPRKPNGACGKSKTWFLILNLFQGKVNEQWLESSQRKRIQQKGAQTKWEPTVDSCPMRGPLKLSSPFPIFSFCELTNSALFEFSLSSHSWPIARTYHIMVCCSKTMTVCCYRQYC